MKDVIEGKEEGEEEWNGGMGKTMMRREGESGCHDIEVAHPDPGER